MPQRSSGAGCSTSPWRDPARKVPRAGGGLAAGPRRPVPENPGLFGTAVRQNRGPSELMFLGTVVPSGPRSLRDPVLFYGEWPCGRAPETMIQWGRASWVGGLTAGPRRPIPENPGPSELMFLGTVVPSGPRSLRDCCPSEPWSLGTDVPRNRGPFRTPVLSNSVTKSDPRASFYKSHRDIPIP